VFDNAGRNNYFISALVMEPVMGEGNPGLAVTPEFYQQARILTQRSKALLIIDSIQAGLRTHGCLSIIDYPGFTKLDPPDCETYSKAINAGQFPLSVLSVFGNTPSLYEIGTYGNTMTSNPASLVTLVNVLTSITKEIRNNINKQGDYFLNKCRSLSQEFPKLITCVQGTGLLISIEIDPSKASVVGENGLEQRLRKRGIGVIHGGANAIRFTPPFSITKEEIDLIISECEDVLKNVT